MAWKRVSLDTIVGTDQQQNTYWLRMKYFFDERNTSGHERTGTSSHHRWNAISTECQKWSACLTNVDKMNPSGCNYAYKVSIAQGLFHGRRKKGDKKKKEKVFTLHHCWTELEHEEKWKNRKLYEIPNKRKQAVVVDDDDKYVSKKGPKTKRPDGRKKEKGAKAGDNDVKEGFEAIVMTQKEYAGEKKEGYGRGEQARARREKAGGRGA